MAKPKKTKSNMLESDIDFQALYEKRDKALKRLVAAWARYSATGEAPDAEEIGIALDALSVAHVQLGLMSGDMAIEVS